MPSEVLEGYLTRDELAAKLKKSKRTLDRWNVLRIGPPRTICGRMILYNIESAREWLASREAKQPGANRRAQRRV